MASIRSKISPCLWFNCDMADGQIIRLNTRIIGFVSLIIIS